MQQFAETITTRSRLRELLPESKAAAVLHKQVDHINEPARRFIASSPFVVIATKGADGLLDVSPKGDPAGFIEVLDDHTLIVPDRLGNHRLDTYENILVDPSIALIFIVPGHTETLRVSGKARIVSDDAVRARHAVNGKPPVLALAVDVEEAFMHCSKSFVRSRLWQPEQWPDLSDTPSLAEWVVCTVAHDHTVDHMQTVHDNDAKTRLY